MGRVGSGVLQVHSLLRSVVLQHLDEDTGDTFYDFLGEGDLEKLE